MTKTFAPSRSVGGVLAIAFGTLLVFVPIFFVLFNPESWKEINAFAIFPGLIFGFFAYVMVSSILKMFLFYRITPKGIQVVKPFHRRLFAYVEIDRLVYLDPEQTRQLIHASIMDQEGFKESGDLIGYFQKIKKDSPAYRYYTLTPSGTSTSVGAKETITSLNVHKTGACVVLYLKDGSHFFLTPANPELFKSYFDQQTS